MAETRTRRLRVAWREYNRRDAWAERLAWAALLIFGGWAVIGFFVALGLAANGHADAAAWALGTWFVDMLLVFAFLMSVDE